MSYSVQLLATLSGCSAHLVHVEAAVIGPMSNLAVYRLLPGLQLLARSKSLGAHHSIPLTQL